MADLVFDDDGLNMMIQDELNHNTEEEEALRKDERINNADLTEEDQALGFTSEDA